MRRSDAPVDAYVGSLPDGVREDVTTLDAELSGVFAGHERVLWAGSMWGATDQRIIGYGSVRQRNRSGVETDWFIVGLTARKAHLSLHVSAVEDGQYLVKRWAGRLGGVKVGSANVTFRRLSELDLPGVLAMVERARDLMSGEGPEEA